MCPPIRVHREARPMIDRRSETSRLLTQYLANNDVRCPFCSYCLHGSTSNRCPECGHQFHLGLIESSGFDGWWAASMFGSLLTATLSLILLAVSLFSDYGVGEIFAHPHYGQRFAADQLEAPHIHIFVSFVVYATGWGALAAHLFASRCSWADWPARPRFIISVIAIPSPLLVPLTMYILYLIG